MATQVISGRLEAGSDYQDGDKKVKISARIEVYPLANPEWQELIRDHQILVNENVVVKIGDVYCVYTQLKAVTLEAMTLMSENRVSLALDENGEPATKQPSVASKWNYGNDLDAKREVRQEWEKSAAGPAKKIDKGIAALVDAGYTEEEAREIVMARKYATA